MGQERDTPPSSFTKRLGRAMLWLLRLFLVIVIGIAVGAAAYVGGMYVYRQYWEPVPVHTIRLDVLQGQQKQAEERLIQQQVGLQDRVDELELQNDVHKLALDELRERLVAVETPQADERTRLDAAYVELEQLQASLAQAQPTRETMQAALDALQAADTAGQTDYEAQQAAVAELERALETAQDELAALQARVVALSAQTDVYGLELAAVNERLTGPRSPAALQHELERVKAMQWLTRARLVLVQNNLGLAQVDLLAARRVLAALQADLPLEQGAQGAAQIAQVIERLDAALGHLPAAPVAAADELEGAWQLLVAGLSPEAPAVPAAEATPEATPAPEASPTPTPTPTPQS